MIVKSERVGAKPDAVEICGKDVWLRRSIEGKTRSGDTGEATVYTYEEVHFTDAGCIGKAYAEANFDDLWTAHELDGIPDAQRIDALIAQLNDAKQAIEDANAAILEIGDLVGGE